MKKILEIANSVEALQDGRIHVEKVNGPFLFEIKGTPAQYLAALKHEDRARLDRNARVGHFHSIYAGGCGPIRLTPARSCQHSRKDGPA